MACATDSDVANEGLTRAEMHAEIVGNMTLVGYNAGAITFPDGKVVVGGDTVVTLAASRKMAGRGPDWAADTNDFRQYRTNNLVSSSVNLICVDGRAMTGTMSGGLDTDIGRKGRV